MATSKVERLLNLVICLLSTRQFVSAEYIRRNVTGYHDDGQSDEAFNRMFERDKTELRDLGIPLVTGPIERGGVDGYRINRESYALPDITLEPDEAAVIATASALWVTPEVSAISQTAVLKLQAAGFDVRADDDLGIRASDSSRSMGSETAIGVVLGAITDGHAVRFTYRPGSAASATTRTLEPWGVVTHRRRWYVVGHDRDRDATRTFRLSRISAVHTVGRAGAVSAPDDVDLQAVVAAAVDSATGPDTGSARIWVADGKAAGLRRLATSTERGTIDGDAGDVLTVQVRSLGTLTRMVLGAGAAAVVLDPPELRDAVIAALDALVGSSV